LENCETLKKQTNKHNKTEVTKYYEYFCYFYFYQILTAFDTLKIISEVAYDDWKWLKLFTGYLN